MNRPFLVLVFSSLFLLFSIGVVSFNKDLKILPVKNIKPLSSPAGTASPFQTGEKISMTVADTDLECLESDEEDCRDFEDVPLDPEDLAGPD